MNNRPTVTLYIPCYNGEAYIAACLDGVLGQFRKPDEILVIDDGSTDRSTEIAESYEGVRVIRHERNKGLAAARNTAVNASQCDFVASLDADCVADRAWLYTLLWLMKQAPATVAGVGGKLIENFQDTAADRYRWTYMRQDQGDERIMGTKYLVGANTMFRREAMLEAGGYDEAFRTNGEDVQMCYRLRELGYALVYEPAATVLHHRRDTVRSVIRMNYAHWRHPSAVYFPPTTLRVAAMRARDRFRYCCQQLRADLHRRQFRLLAISLRSILTTPLWEFRDWRRIRRRGDVTAIEQTAAKARTFRRQFLERAAGSSAPRPLHS